MQEQYFQYSFHLTLSSERYANAICKPIALQFTGSDKVAMLELTIREDSEILRLNIVEEKHYELVPRSEISSTELHLLMESEP